MCLHPAIPNNLGPVHIHNPLRHDLVPPHRGPELGPQRPVHATQNQNTHAHHGEHIVRIPIRPEIAVGRRDERHNRQKGIAQQEDNCHRQPGAPARVPLLFLLVLQVDEAAGDEAVDPGAGVRVQVDDEVVGRSGGRREQDDDGYKPVEEELRLLVPSSEQQTGGV